MTDIMAQTDDRPSGRVPTFDTTTAAQIEYVVEHVNATHADAVLFVARHLDPDANDAELGPVDPLGATFTIRRADGTAGAARLEFPSPASGVDDAPAPSAPATRHACDRRADDGLLARRGLTVTDRIVGWLAADESSPSGPRAWLAARAGGGGVDFRFWGSERRPLWTLFTVRKVHLPWRAWQARQRRPGGSAGAGACPCRTTVCGASAWCASS